MILSAYDRIGFAVKFKIFSCADQISFVFGHVSRDDKEQQVGSEWISKNRRKFK